MKPLHILLKRFYRQPVPIIAWTSKGIALLSELKVGVTSSPVLGRFYPDKCKFLKTDWSAECMVWILVQPADDEESNRVTKVLQEPGK